MADYIYTMQGVTKVHPPDKKVLSNIYLSFLPGAKIGVLGANGSGKSSLLRIMAGVDKTFAGEAWAKPGASIGFLPQEPELGKGKTVKECVEDGGRRDARAAHALRGAVSMKLGEALADDEMNKVLEEHGKLQDKIDAADGWNLDHRARARDGRAAPAAGRRRGHEALGRREAPRRAVPDPARAPDMLLLDEPTNHLDAESVAWLEQHLHEYPGSVVAVTHDRYFLDNVAEWILELDRGAGIPFKGNYSSWLEQKRAAARAGGEGRSRRASASSSTSSSGCARRRARARPRARRASPPTNAAQRAEQRRSATPSEIFIPPGPRLGDVVIEAERLEEGVRRQAARSTTSPSSCRAAASSASSARTAPARPRCSA